jgi:hypothetical protein
MNNKRKEFSPLKKKRIYTDAKCHIVSLYQEMNLVIKDMKESENKHQLPLYCLALYHQEVADLI